jgi:hypothetical protein
MRRECYIRKMKQVRDIAATERGERRQYIYREAGRGTRQRRWRREETRLEQRTWRKEEEETGLMKIR